MRRSVRISAIIALTVAIAGCSEMFVLESATVMVTEKTSFDHAVSALSGKDCSVVRKEAGRTYCVEDERHPTPAAFCYRTLGDVTCYDRPDPHVGHHQKVGENDHNFRTPR